MQINAWLMQLSRTSFVAKTERKHPGTAGGSSRGSDIDIRPNTGNRKPLRKGFRDVPGSDGSVEQ